MLNGASALGILGGSSGGAVPNTIPSLALFKQISKNEGKLRETFFNRKDVQKDIETFKNKVSGFKDVDELVKDRKSLQILLTAFDLGSEINNGGKIKAVLKSDPSDLNSFANRLNDPRFAELANFVNFEERKFRSLTTASSQQNLIDKYLQNRFELEVGGANGEIAKAFFFLRNINSITSTAGLLGNMQLRTIATTTLRLPPQIASQSLEKQIQLIESKFDVKKAVVNSEASDLRINNQAKIRNDIQAIEVAKSQVTNAESTLSIINTRLQNLRTLQFNLPSHMDTSESGINDKEIAIQTSAVKKLKNIAGANSAAKAAIDELEPILKQLDGLVANMRAEEIQANFDSQKASFAELAARIPDLVNHTARFADPNTGKNINLFKPGGGTVDAGQPNSYEAKKLDYAYQLGSLGSNPITVQSGTLGSNPFTVQSGTLGSNPFTVQSGTLGSNPFTIKGGDLPGNPWRWFADHTPARDSDDTAILKLRIADHGLQAGDKITVSGTSNAFGADLNGTYTVHSVRSSDVIHIDVGVDLGSPPATNENGGGSSGTFATNRVQVNHAEHPFGDGDTATFSGASSVGGQSANSSFTVQNQSTNSYEFLLGSPGSAAATGGGGSVTVNASDQVTVAHTGHPFSNGETVNFSGGASVGGVSLNGDFQVSGVSSNSYTITASSQATAGSGGGSSVSVNASDQVTVAHTGHPFSNGDTVTFSGGASVGGVSLNGNFTVANASSNSYTFTAASQGQAGSGGGSSVSVNASDQVTIDHTGHRFAIGDHVTLSNTSAVGGLSFNDTFEITDIAENSYTITFSSKGTAASGGGNTIGYGHSLGNNPFTTSSGSSDVTVTHKGHGLSVGDVIAYSNGSSVGGLDFDKTFRVSGITNSDTYIITAQSNATSTANGGGGAVGFTLDELASIVDTTASSISASNKDLATFVTKIASAASTVASASLSDTLADSDTAKGFLIDANTEFADANRIISVNNSTFASETGKVNWGASLNTSGLAKGQASIDDSILRASKVDDNLRKIATLANQTVTSETQAEYIDLRADIVSLLGTPGSIKGTAAGTLDNNPFATNNGSVTVTVTDAGHQFIVGDSVTFSGALAVGGLDLNNTFTINSISANSYTVTASSSASSDASGGGSSVAFTGIPTETLDNLLDLDKLGSNPFTTTSGSSTVTVEHNSHGFSTGDYVTFDNVASAPINGLRVGIGDQRTFLISVTDSNHYTITADTLTDPLTTTAGSSTVSAEIEGHGFNVNDTVTFSGGSAVGGLTLNGTFTVTGVTNANHFTFSSGSSASSSAKGGGTVAIQATGNGVGGGSSVRLKDTYNIRPNPDGSEQLAVNSELRDIDSNGPYGLSDSTRLASLLPSALNSVNAADIITGANTLSKDAETVRKSLQTDKVKFDFYANVADPQGAIDTEIRKLKSELDGIIASAEKDGKNLIADFASDIVVQIDSLGKKVTIEAQDTIKTILDGKFSDHYFAVLNGEGASITTLGSSPFATVKDSTTVTVTQANHTFKEDDFVSFRSIDGSDVNGVDLNKTFLITSVSDGAYTFTANTAATATGSGGGSSVEVSSVTDRINLITDAKFLVDSAFSKMKSKRVALNIELSILNNRLNREPEVETQFLKPLKNTDYAIKFIEKYLLIQDLATTGNSIVPTNNNALAVGLIKNITPSKGIGLSVNMLS